jgi:tRNA (adenine37-N6)-methyltransferase
VSTALSFTPIGTIRTPWREKFGVPRQPGMATIPCQLWLPQPWGSEEAVRGLAGFSHLWLIFHFHQIAAGKWQPTVRPPRLGGNQRVGLFASRSTHRPNPIGLSLVQLTAITCRADGCELEVVGADLVDGTPILDIKPYLPWVEAICDARAGYAATPPPRLNISWSDAALATVASQPQLKQAIEETLSCDPRPAYHDDPQRHYGVIICGSNVRFSVARAVVRVEAVEAV